MLLSWDLLMTQFVPSGNCGTDVLTLTQHRGVRTSSWCLFAPTCSALVSPVCPGSSLHAKLSYELVAVQSRTRRGLRWQVMARVVLTHSEGVSVQQGGVSPQKVQLRRQQSFPVG